jgi:outer membrane protein assembly factor BamA
MRAFSTRATIIAIAAAAAAAHAGPPLEPHPEPMPNEPPPGDESGRIDTPETDGAGRVFLRGVLFAPKLVTEALFLPIRSTVYVYDRYRLDELYYEWFFTPDLDLGVVPTASYATGFGVSVGAALIANNTFGQRERANVSATWGGTYRMTADAWLDSGTRWGPFQAQIGGSIFRIPNEPFYGIGNKGTGPRPNMLVDPVSFPDAIETRFRWQSAVAQASVGYNLTNDLLIAAHARFDQVKYSQHPTTGLSPELVYIPEEITGFNTTTNQFYPELELRWDSRRRVSRWEPVQLHTEGTLADGWGGYLVGLNGASSYWHYGADLQQFVRVASGPRMLMFRLFASGVTGNIDQVPITELPYLGGDFLRGYDYGRFRDRFAMFGTAQYYWDISKFTDVYLFADVGRVYHSPEDITLTNMRAGFGVGLQIQSDHGFLIEGFVATSIDGGVVVTAALTPIFDQRPRWR